MKVHFTKTDREAIFLIDKFLIPGQSIDEFTEQLKYNRAFVANLAGYLRGEALEKVDGSGNLIIMTIAVWENQNSFNDAKQSVQAEFQRIGFNPVEFYKRLRIKMEREQFIAFNDSHKRPQK